jgi:hypothetical protein
MTLRAYIKPYPSSPFPPPFPRSNRRKADEIPRRKAPSTAAKSIPSRRIREPEPLISCPFSLPLFCAPVETISWFKVAAVRALPCHPKVTTARSNPSRLYSPPLDTIEHIEDPIVFPASRRSSSTSPSPPGATASSPPSNFSAGARHRRRSGDPSR